MTDQTAATQWREGYDRVVGLARTAGDAGLAARVPACPDWTARDLLAHMIGVGTDALAGEVPDDTNPGWTQGQIEHRSDADLETLLTEWQEHADRIETFVGDTDPTPLADLIIHEQDLRGALGTPGARDTEGLGLVRDTVLEQFGGALAELSESRPIQLSATDADWSWRSGEGDPGAAVAAPSYDLTRALTSRRTADELRAWTVQGSIDPYLDAFAGMGPLPERSLAE